MEQNLFLQSYQSHFKCSITMCLILLDKTAIKYNLMKAVLFSVVSTMPGMASDIQQFTQIHAHCVGQIASLVINGHKFEQTPGDSGGQRSLTRYSPWGLKESDMTEVTQHRTEHIMFSRSIHVGTNGKISFFFKYVICNIFSKAVAYLLTVAFEEQKCLI